MSRIAAEEYARLVAALHAWYTRPDLGQGRAP